MIQSAVAGSRRKEPLRLRSDELCGSAGLPKLDKARVGAHPNPLRKTTKPPSPCHAARAADMGGSKGLPGLHEPGLPQNLNRSPAVSGSSFLAKKGAS